jgi:hypothetical protein
LLKATDNRHTWLISIWNQGCSPVIPCINLLCYCKKSQSSYLITNLCCLTSGT